MKKLARVLAVAPMPPEKSAYALARYSRSPDSIRDSIEWVRTHDSTKFLESFYFQYGHASIADLGHVVLCFEGVSELAATEIEDEQLWDGQARSSRYQDFSRSGFVTPPGLDTDASANLQTAGARACSPPITRSTSAMCEFLAEKLPRPEDMKPDAYQRNIAARAFDVARYTLFFGIPTGVGQVTSIRTLERQIRRLKSSEYAEVREIAGRNRRRLRRRRRLASGILRRRSSHWRPRWRATSIRTSTPSQSRQDLEASGRVQNLPAGARGDPETVDLLEPDDTHAEIAATLLYPVTDRPFRELYEMAAAGRAARRNEVIDVALRSRTAATSLLRGFRGGLYAFDIVMDIGAYRDLHRHRRCQQFRQAYSSRTPRLRYAGVAWRSRTRGCVRGG